ncbi:transcriptional adapter 2-alpha-like isoform X2 [Phymastichus coffea]|uniref:transcriptional adapter 2-alpha-like isoform X2 n=1 Tax=Phymastichus coffea TaxID=108790 RepID=UPI00273CB0ED|nr:transcriptional adapter 2-alpha-like isoform X2 [Phymastichus coffea]
MSNLNIDTIEEDAADLQFPKDWTSYSKHCKKLKMSVEKGEHYTLDTNCFICKCIIIEPYIYCAICNIILCTTCFANDSGWLAWEVKSLLDLLHEYGYGNWDDISNRLKGKSSIECESYYIQNFVDDQSIPNLPKLKKSTSSSSSFEPISFIFQLENIENPPRFASGTINYKLIGGYNAARSDFEVNFDNYAALEISKLKYDSSIIENRNCNLEQCLQIAIVQSYNMRLKERARRQKVIRNHGLISIRKMTSCLLRYNYTVTRLLADRMRIFSQILDMIEFDSMMECLHRIGELKTNLNQLFIYRKCGLQNFYSVLLFDDLNKLRQEYDKNKKQHLVNNDYNWQKNISVELINNTSLSTNLRKRKIAPPLDIHSGMKEYNKLDRNERDLCSVVRILPELYVEIKHLLISENKKCGTVKLAHARNLLKIDVNKTKKIHEFLAKHHYIRIN